MNIKHNFLKSTFFPSTITEGNKLDPAIRNSTSFNSFKGYLRYKTITSQNMPSEAQVKNFLVS